MAFRAFVVLIVAFLGDSSALACSMVPLDVAAFARKLKPHALYRLGTHHEDLIKVSTTDATARYIWTDPMCPEGIAGAATFDIQYKNPSIDDDEIAIQMACKAKVRVVKQYPTKLSHIVVRDVLQIELFKGPDCGSIQ